MAQPSTEPKVQAKNDDGQGMLATIENQSIIIRRSDDRFVVARISMSADDLAWGWIGAQNRLFDHGYVFCAGRFTGAQGGEPVEEY